MKTSKEAITTGKVLIGLICFNFASFVATEQERHILRQWSQFQIQKLLIENNEESTNGNSITPLSLVLLPESYKTERCLDGSSFGYYIRRSKSSLKSHKWVFLLEGGGLCVEPIDCVLRKNSDEGSSLFWKETFMPGTDGLKDILSDNPQQNPYFYDYNHVYLKYCSGDTWTGTKSGFDQFGLWFSGHNNIKAVIDHLNQTETLKSATHVFLLGLSAGGIGVHNNADYFRERWISPSTIFRAASVGGFYFPGPVVLFPEYILNISIPVNNFASKYLTSWYGSALDENCLENTAERHQHRCWDSHYLYNFIDTRLFVMENRFDKSQIHDVLLCPYDHVHNNSTESFIKWFGDNMSTGLGLTVEGDRGKKKGDGLFSPSCLSHTTDFCIQGGPTVHGEKIGNILPKWFLEDDPTIASTYQKVDLCNHIQNTKLPCNTYCQC